jgi:RNA polymerase sigma factor (sigma-70 family)
MKERLMEKSYKILKNGNLKINDNLQFLKLLSGVKQDHYNKLVTYGKKILNKTATDIPYEDQLMIVNMAIVKAMSSFDPEAGANLLTYFSMKIKGEVSDYRAKKQSMINKVHKLAHSMEGSFLKSFDKESGETKLEVIEEELIEDTVVAEDIYHRKLQAFRMAFSGIPLYSQSILNRIVLNGETLEQIAQKEGKTTVEIVEIRNQALSLIFARVLRSNHLEEDEKEEIKREHDLV